MSKKRVLFLCTGNSARSQMAEGLINHFLGERWEAFSAGTKPAGYVHPMALRATAELGIDISAQRSKSVDEFRDTEFDFVITVCDNAAQNCPLWLGPGRAIHIGFPDPAAAVGSDDERLERMQAVGCRNIMLVIAGAENPALPVESQVIDKFVFRDMWFDVSYHLPHQLGFCFDYVALMDKDDLTPQLCALDETYSDAELKARAQANLRLLHVRIYRYEKYARREEWVGLDLSAIKNSIVDTLMVLNDQPSYNRYSSRIGRLLRDLPLQPERLEERLLDILLPSSGPKAEHAEADAGYSSLELVRPGHDSGEPHKGNTREMLSF